MYNLKRNMHVNMLCGKCEIKQLLEDILFVFKYIIFLSFYIQLKLTWKFKSKIN